MAWEDQAVKRVRLATPFVFLTLTALAHAHVGSTDIFLEGKAGPYQLFVTVRPPLTIPGVAEIEVRSESAGVREMKAVPLAIKGAGSKLAPIPDALKVSANDPKFFAGQLWMMTSGSWQARLTVEGAQGEGTLSIPVPAVARASKRMQWGLGLVLSCVGIFLVTGLVAIVGASVREARLDPGQTPAPANLRSGRKATIIGAVIVLAIVFGGNAWWNSEAQQYDKRIYKPLRMAASLKGSELHLRMTEPGWMQAISLEQAAFRVFTRKMDDLIPDHGHIMHLYMIRQPGLDVVYHLHPEERDTGSFVLPLPSTEAGHYKLYADIVHADGFPETLTSEIDLPALASRPLAGDDAFGQGEAWQKWSPNTIFTLPDGYKMEWLRPSEAIHARQGTSFNFRLLKPDGTTPADMSLYMGMLGHAAFVKTDDTVFAHIHPNGSISMAALMLAEGMPADMKMDGTQGVLPNAVGFPFGFPSPGKYRIFVQMKHAETVETGIFDVDCLPAEKG
jgi:hypothetical protein